MTKKQITILSVLIDIIFGDPPNRFHPVAWMGSLIKALQKAAPKINPVEQMAFGGLLVTIGGILAASAGNHLIRLVSKFSKPLGSLLEALLLKSTFSMRGLDSAAIKVEQALEAGNLPAARELVSYHLVSRETDHLTPSQVSGATIESIAENASDSFIAPLFYYQILGLPGAIFYRFANTADAMLGYRDPAREWLGKIPARLDDLLNIIPARFSGALIAISSFLFGKEKPARSWKIIKTDAKKTASPNAGYPMSAVAGALDIKLEKTDQYVLGENLPEPQAEDITRARSLVKFSFGLFITLITLVQFRTTNNK